MRLVRMLFRGRLLCGYCGLRMKGHRGTFPYYRRHITMQRAANIPPGHPATINLSERFLLEATLGFLAQAVHGPDRLAYWQQVLESAEQAEPPPPRHANASPRSSTPSPTCSGDCATSSSASKTTTSSPRPAAASPVASPSWSRLSPTTRHRWASCTPTRTSRC